MSHYYFNPAPPNSLHMAGAQAPFSSHQPHHNNHHHPNNRSRKGPRFSSGSSQNSAKHFKPHLRATRESAEAAQLATTRKDFEAARSFDLEDDEVFCPWHLLTEDDVRTISSKNELYPTVDYFAVYNYYYAFTLANLWFYPYFAAWTNLQVAKPFIPNKTTDVWSPTSSFTPSTPPRPTDPRRPPRGHLTPPLSSHSSSPPPRSLSQEPPYLMSQVVTPIHSSPATPPT